MQVNFPKTQHFCESYWQHLRKSGRIKECSLDTLSQQWKLSNINSYYMGMNPDGVIYKDKAINIPKIVRDTDIEFLCLKPTKENIVLWRGLARPSDIYPYANKCYNDSLELKKGNTIRLPGYIFASNDKNTAETFGQLDMNYGILYKINVPAGANILTNTYYIFPRNSKFVCTDSVKIHDADKSYQLISLNYIKPLIKYAGLM